MSNSLPLIETPEENAQPRRFPRYWLVLGSLVLAHAVFGAYFNQFGGRVSREDEFRADLLIGTILSQPILFAIWASFGPQRLYQRFLWSLLPCILVAFIADVGQLMTSAHPELGMLMMLDTAAFLATTTVFLLVRRFFHWGIIQPNTDLPESIYRASQFGIKHLMILTTIAALGLGLFQSLVVLSHIPTTYPALSRFVITICFVLVFSFPIFAITWLMLAGEKV